jgi:hypothetical protein
MRIDTAQHEVLQGINIMCMFCYGNKIKEINSRKKLNVTVGIN